MKKVIFVAAIIFLLIIASIRIFSGGEDNWVCDKGEWVKHGHPDTPKPEGNCTGQLSEVKVFFGNSQIDPSALECGTTYGVTRKIDFAGSKYGIAVKELLAGPTAAETKQGYFTSLNPNLAQPKIDLVDGLMTVDFQPDFSAGVGGSCRVAAIRSQIVNTLKQFSEVRDVVVSVNGDSAEVLQP